MKTSENWPDQRHAGHCGCTRCQRESRMVDRLAREGLSVALRHAQDASALEGFGAEAPSSRPTPPGTLAIRSGTSVHSLGAWSGWQGANRSLLSVFLGTASDSSPAFPGANIWKLKRSNRLLYRIAKAASGVYIGEAFAKSIEEEVKDKLRGVINNSGAVIISPTRQLNLTRGEVAKLKRQIIYAKTISNYTIDWGYIIIDRGSYDPKRLHTFELALQVLEKPSTYDGRSRTFEQDDADDWF